MNLDMVVVCDASAAAQDVMSLAGTLLAYRENLGSVRALGLDRVGARYWNAVASSPLFVEWLEPVAAVGELESPADALIRMLSDHGRRRALIVPIAGIDYGECLKIGLETQLTESVAVLRLASRGSNSVIVCLTTETELFDGLAMASSATSQGLLENLAISVVGSAASALSVASNDVACRQGHSASLPVLEPGLNPEFTVIVPTLDMGSSRFRRLRESLYNCTDVAFQIITVDNGKSAQGFAGPVNAGIRACSTRYAVIINDDVVVTPGWWPPLKRELEAGSWVVFPMTEGGTRADFAAWCFALDLSYFSKFSFSDTNLFDPKLKIWFQDSDLYLRLVRSNNPPVLVSDSLIVHYCSTTVATNDPLLRDWITKIIEEDQASFVERWGIDALVTIGFVDPIHH